MKLFKYDLLYLKKTSKILIFVVVFVLFSIITALTARYMNQILEWALGADAGLLGQQEVTTLGAYEQYISDLYELLFTITLFVVVSIFISDKTKGLLPLIFSKPVNRDKYILSKYFSALLVIAIAIICGYLAFSYYTYYLFDEVFFIRGIGIMALFFLDIVFASAIAMFASTYSKNYILAIVISWGIYIVFMILSAFRTVAVFEYLPGVIQGTMFNVLHQTHDGMNIFITVIVTLLISFGLLSASIMKNRNLEI